VYLFAAFSAAGGRAEPAAEARKNGSGHMFYLLIERCFLILRHPGRLRYPHRNRTP
jgi:hypothetical protein